MISLLGWNEDRISNLIVDLGRVDDEITAAENFDSERSGHRLVTESEFVLNTLLICLL